MSSHPPHQTVSGLYERYATTKLRKKVGIGVVLTHENSESIRNADFLHYKQHGYGITGLTYRAMQYGPVSEGWGRIYSSLPGIVMEEFVYPSGQSGIQLKIDSPSDISALSESEQETLSRVCELFKDMSAGDISNASHKEKAWADNVSTKSEISYQEAFALNY